MSQWKREIKEHPARVTKAAPLEVKELKTWMESQAKQYNLQWLLVHADDGVIWGRFDAKDYKLNTSEEVARNIASAVRSVCVTLRLETIQQARLFGESCEVLLFRTGDTEVKYRIIEDVEENKDHDLLEAFDETYLLWGTHGEALENEFTLLTDGAQGLMHAVPIKLSLGKNNETTPPYLLVRHYLNKEGVAKVIASRLVNLVNTEVN